jgi:hypothetical protein
MPFYEGIRKSVISLWTLNNYKFNKKKGDNPNKPEITGFSVLFAD